MRLRPLLAALRFLTRLPVPDPYPLTDVETGRVPLWYPAAGLAIGLALLLLQFPLANLPPALGAALLLVAWVWLTGALHLDGLADSADAWVGGLGDRERTLAIMKDPCSGPVGVTAVVLVLLVKFAALQTLLLGSGTLALLWAPLLARAALTALLLTTPYVRPGGMGAGPARHLARRQAVWVLAGVGIALPLAAGGAGLILLLINILALLGLRQRLRARIGGTTGDTAGALVELLEVLTLVTWGVLSPAPLN